MKYIRVDVLSLILTVMMLASTIAVFRAHAATTPWYGYVKPAYPDYAPSGMPDFDEKQDNWGPFPGTYTWCGPVAVANSLWWLDSEYESLLGPNPVPPPTISDNFSLVSAYVAGQWDDHSPMNVDPLVRDLAALMDTDGQTSQDGHIGTRWADLVSGINKYLVKHGVANLFEVHNSSFPTFTWIDTETEKCQDVELFLEFWQWTGSTWLPLTGNETLMAGHIVTVAGANSTVNPGEVLISDPLQDAFEAGTAPRGGREPVMHPSPHGSMTHNDAQLVSQDGYQVKQWTPPPIGPYGAAQNVSELVGYLQTLGYGPNWYTFIRAAVATSPREVSEWPGYIKPEFPDYAPSGMPDFDEKQSMFATSPGRYTWCVPVAVANSLWWLDSEYESIMFPGAVPPPTISDHFNLVTLSNPQQWDDHDPQNVASLVITLAYLMDTDGIRTQDGHLGTRLTDVQSGIQQYLLQQGVANLFEVHNSSFPTFEWIENETEVCQDVELFLDFWQLTPEGWKNTTITNPSLELGHSVTSAGVNSTASKLLISDPYQDAYEAGKALGRSPVAHLYPHVSAVHNDTQYVSQDEYSVGPYTFPPIPLPPGYPQIVWELQGYLQTMGLDPSYHAFIREAVATSPVGIHDVAVTNVTSAKTVICQGYGGNETVTVQNQGNFTETFNVTVYANTTSVASQNVTLSSGNSTAITFTWNTSGFVKGNYTIKAVAAPVPGETDTVDNNCTDGLVVVAMVGDVNADGKVEGKDLGAIAWSFGSYPGAPPPMSWDPNCDIDNDGKVDGKDLGVVSWHFGEWDP
jgi:hypothetical protein